MPRYQDGAGSESARHRPEPALAMAVGALGVVFGDIGTSPLYAMRETFRGHGHEIVVDSAAVLGILSLIFWSLVVIISVKYLLFVMRADNEGEGGILALTSLVRADRSRGRRQLILLGLFGTALLYGDGLITPAISVLSAVEGTEQITDGLDGCAVPISVVILLVLFAVQRRGTAAIGRLFGPVMLAWFAVLAVLGLHHVLADPSVLRAVSPVYGARFFLDHGVEGFLALGSVFLVVTGGEALYADMDHFRVLPARRAEVQEVVPGVHQVVLRYGFMEEPSVVQGLREGAAGRLRIDPSKASFFLGSESLVVTKRAGMARWREHLFAFFSRNATPAQRSFGLPPERTVTLGQEILL